MHIWEIYVHMYTIYEVSMSHPVQGGGVHRHQCQHQCQHQCRTTLTLMPMMTDKA